MTTPRSAPPARPWGCVLLLLAAFLLVRGVVLTRPEPATWEWPRPPFMNSLTIDPLGRMLVASGGGVAWYQPLTGILDDTLPIGQSSAITSLTLSSDGQFVGLGTTSGDVTIWSVTTKQVVAHRQLIPPAMRSQQVRNVIFSPDGSTVGGRSDYMTPTNQRINRIEVWNRTTQTVIWSQEWTPLPGSTVDKGPTQIRFSPDGQFILLAGDTLEIRQVQTNALVRRITPDPRDEQGFSSVVISPDQQWVASSTRTYVTIRRFRDGAVVHVLPAPPSEAPLLAFSPDSRFLAVAAQRTNYFAGMQPVTLWQVADGRPVQTFQGHNEGAQGMAYSPDGQYLVSFGDNLRDNTVRVWRVSPHNPFEPLFWLGGGLALLLVAVGRWIWQRRMSRA